MGKPQSIKKQILSRLATPLLALVLLNAAVSYPVALHYANLAYDRWLIDSAKSLAQDVKSKGERVFFEFPPIADELFRRNDIDETFFKVESEVEGFLAGDRRLPVPKIGEVKQDEPFFFDGSIGRQPVRIATVLVKLSQRSGNVLISVGETLRKRHNMMREFFLAIVLPQILLIVMAALYIRIGVDRGLVSLNNLAGRIAARSAKDFSPIGDDDVPFEAQPLMHAINDLLSRLLSALAAQQRFVENTAHQLRTPLAGLKLQAERALCVDDTESMKQALAHIKTAADRLNRLNRQLLVLARSESRVQHNGALKKVNLVRLVRSCCRDWVPKALERNIELSFEAEAVVVEIAGDDLLLREVLGNLLDNAVRYGRSGGRICVGVYRAPARLCVADDGAGIAMEDRERIFERFYRASDSPGEGCGLGLAIVREIAELHHAELRVGAPLLWHSGTQIELIFDG